MMVDFKKLRKAKSNKNQSNLQQVGISGKVKEEGVNYCECGNCECESTRNFQVKHNGKLVFIKNVCGFHYEKVKNEANRIYDEIK